MFRNRTEAGVMLAEKLAHYRNEDVVVFALPRGGVVTAEPITEMLGAPLDLLFVNKIGHPAHPEYAIGAISESGKMLGSERDLANVDQTWLAKEKTSMQAKASERRELYLQGRAPLDVKGKVAILVDDGIATGLTMRVGILELKALQPNKIVVAVPVAPSDTFALLQKDVDEVVIIYNDPFFGSVGAYYEHFDQVTDQEVIATCKN